MERNSTQGQAGRSILGRGTFQIPPEGFSPGATAAAEAACTGWVLGLTLSSTPCFHSQDYTRETKSLS